MKSKKIRTVVALATAFMAVVGIIMCIPNVTVNVHRYITPNMD